jgi:hypothetical protein
MARINDIVISEMTFNAMLRKMHNNINYPAARLRELHKCRYTEREINKKRVEQKRRIEIEEILREEKREQEIREIEKTQKNKLLRKNLDSLSEEEKQIRKLIEKEDVKKINNLIINDIKKYLSEDETNQLLLTEDCFTKMKDFSPIKFSNKPYSVWANHFGRKNCEFDGGGSYWFEDSTYINYYDQFLFYYFKYKKKYKLLNPSIIYVTSEGLVRCLIYENYDFVAELKPFEF